MRVRVRVRFRVRVRARASRLVRLGPAALVNRHSEVARLVLGLSTAGLARVRGRDPSIFGRLGWVRVRVRVRVRVGVGARPGLEPWRTTSSPSASAWRNASSLVSGAGALRASWGLDLPGFRPRPRPVVSATSSESTCAPCSTCSGTAARSCEAVGCADVNGSAAGRRRRSALAGGVGTNGHGGAQWRKGLNARTERLAVPGVLLPGVLVALLGDRGLRAS